MDTVRTALVTAVLVYAAVLGALYVFQRSLQYFPDTRRIAPPAAGLAGVEEVAIETADGETLVAWYAPAPPGRPTIVYFHGNGGALWARADRVALFSETGFGVLLLSYRGYGGSTGSPTEAGLFADARAAVAFLAGRGAAPASLIYYGESLGSGVAVRMAADHPPAGLVLEAPFTSAADVAAGIYWWLPVRLLMKDQFDSLSLIRRVNAPLAVIHGDRDAVVPFVLGKRLFEAANDPKTFIVLEGQGHNAPLEPAVWEKARTFLESGRK